MNTPTKYANVVNHEPAMENTDMNDVTSAIPEQCGKGMEIPTGAVIPVAAFALPIQQAVPAEEPKGEALSLDIEQRASKGVFTLPHPLTWGHWIGFWLLAVLFVTLAGLLFGAGLCVLAILLCLVGAFVIKSRDDERRKPISPSASTVVPTSDATGATPVVPSCKKCPFCAEAIRYEAVLCRFCQKDQPTGNVIPADETPDAHMQLPPSLSPSHARQETQADRIVKGVCAFLFVLLVVGGSAFLCWRLSHRENTEANAVFTNPPLNAVGPQPREMPPAPTPEKPKPKTEEELLTREQIEAMIKASVPGSPGPPCIWCEGTGVCFSCNGTGIPQGVTARTRCNECFFGKCSKCQGRGWSR